jgi:hypothetical protein
MDQIELPASNSIFEYFHNSNFHPKDEVTHFVKEFEKTFAELTFTAALISKTIKNGDYNADHIKRPNPTEIYLRSSVKGLLEVDDVSGNYPHINVSFTHDHTGANKKESYGTKMIDGIPKEKLHDFTASIRSIAVMVESSLRKFQGNFNIIERDFQSLEQMFNKNNMDLRDYDKFYSLTMYYRSITRSISNLIKMFALETTRYQKTLVRYIDASITLLEEEKEIA